MNHQSEAQEIVKTLNNFIVRINEVESLIETNQEIDLIVDKASTLKSDLKKSVKRGTVNNNKEKPTEMENLYFYEAIYAAELRLQLMKLNSNPFKANWVSRLQDARDDIRDYLRILEQFLSSK